MTTTQRPLYLTGDQGRDRLRNPSINAPHTADEALAAVIGNIRRSLETTKPRTTDAGFGLTRSQQQTDWLNDAQAKVTAILGVALDAMDPARREEAETDLHVAERRVREEQEFIEEHGGNLAGYIARYGSASDEEHYGSGGEAIYQADLGALRRWQDEVRRLRGE